MTMSRLTITLSDQRHRALKETAARRGKTIGEIVEASLECYGIKTTETASELVRRARESAAQDADKALEIAVDESRKQRSEA